jgi:hypothetical protein
VGYYHCSDIEHPIGMRLTGPATRDAISPWSGKEPTYNPNRVYVFVGQGDPRLLSSSSVSSKPKIVYEVKAEGELQPDMNGGTWRTVSCDSAVITKCVYRPAPDQDLSD